MMMTIDPFRCLGWYTNARRDGHVLPMTQPGRARTRDSVSRGYFGEGRFVPAHMTSARGCSIIYMTETHVLRQTPMFLFLFCMRFVRAQE